MDIVEFAIGKTAVIAAFRDEVCSDDHPCVAETADAVTATRYGRNTCPFDRGKDRFLVMCIQNMDFISDMNGQFLCFFRFYDPIMDHVSFLTDPLETQCCQFLADMIVHGIGTAHEQRSILIKKSFHEIRIDEAMKAALRFFL